MPHDIKGFILISALPRASAFYSDEDLQQLFRIWNTLKMNAFEKDSTHSPVRCNSFCFLGNRKKKKNSR